MTYENQEPPQAGSNSQKYHKEIVEAVTEYNKLDEISADCNEKRQAIREQLSDMGLDTKAFEVAAKHAAWDALKRERFDISYDTCRAALDSPFNPQGDLFKFSKEAQEAAEKENDADLDNKLDGQDDGQGDGEYQSEDTDADSEETWPDDDDIENRDGSSEQEDFDREVDEATAEE